MKLKTKLIKTIALALITTFSMQPLLYAATTPKTVAQASVSSSYTWDLAEFFKTKSDWLEASKKIEATEMASQAQSVPTNLSIAVSFEAPELLALSS